MPLDFLVCNPPLLDFSRITVTIISNKVTIIIIIIIIITVIVKP